MGNLFIGSVSHHQIDNDSVELNNHLHT